MNDILTMAGTQVQTGIGALWQQRIHSLREYEVVRDGNVFGSGFSNNCVHASEYDFARRYLDRLLVQYQGLSFLDVFEGHDEFNEAGACFRIQSDVEIPGIKFDIDGFRHDILSDLTLVRGIGEKIQQNLKARGYDTLEDLLHHPKFRTAAEEVVEQLSSGKSVDMMDLIGSRHSRSHPLALGTAGFYDPDAFVFIDIETMGLFSRPIILFGVGTIEGKKLVVRQYLLRDVADEQAALVATMNHLSGENPALVTFNGKSFDFPYILDRLSYYGIRPRSRIPHFDMLHFSRRRWKNELSSLRLSALEKEILGVVREEDIPGQMVPEFYETYLRTGNCGPLVPIVEHNKQDVVSLAQLFFLLLGELYGC